MIIAVIGNYDPLHVCAQAEAVAGNYAARDAAD